MARGHRRLAALASVGLLVTAAASCGEDAGQVGAGVGESASGAVAEVEVLDNTFGPDDLVVDPGTTVQWTNSGRNSHNIKAIDGPDGFGVDAVDFAPGATYEFTFGDAGAFAYYCTIHGAPSGGQTGRVVVGAAGEQAAAAADAEDETDPARATDGVSGTLRVPADFETIQAAVDEAAPGDLVLVSPGVYEEAVTVSTDDLTLRGLDRNEVVLDGGFELENGIFVVEADGVVVENMTARNYVGNGFFWNGVDGYRGSYLTAYRNGDYGVYAFDSVNGQFDHSYASGSPDAGFYIGQCYPCNAVITDVVSEYNGLGYSGTNAGGDLVIKDSIFRFNRAGIVPNSGDYEKYPPERETTIVGNLVYSNNQADTPAIDAAMLAMGNGILIAGGIDNVILRNLVVDHDIAGIAGVPLPDENYWPATGNTVEGNVVEDSRMADLAIFAGPGDGNCFAGNSFATSVPPGIEDLIPCGGEPSDFEQDLTLLDELINRSKPPKGDFKTQPVPPEQEGMDDPEGAPVEPARRPAAVDVDEVQLPERPEGL
jgi:plastocyanin